MDFDDTPTTEYFADDDAPTTVWDPIQNAVADWAPANDDTRAESPKAKRQ